LITLLVGRIRRFYENLFFGTKRVLDGVLEGDGVASKRFCFSMKEKPF
jgi:hypothetical protein